MSKEIILGLDVGARRIGVAWGDTDVRLATPLPAIYNEETVFEKIHSIVSRLHVSAIVIGLPRNNSGEETKQSLFCRDFANDLNNYLLMNGVDDKDIILQDESLTSVVAEESLKKDKKHYNVKMLRDGTLDSKAAAIILSDYLEGLR